MSVLIVPTIATPLKISSHQAVEHFPYLQDTHTSEFEITLLILLDHGRESNYSRKWANGSAVKVRLFTLWPYTTIREHRRSPNISHCHPNH